ncbi:MAG TPA: hypothetical protein VGK74_04760 [Symbiobacteriaceae bacterium]|jgi:hypothetical protein
MDKDEIVRLVLAEVERRLNPAPPAPRPRRLALVEPGSGLPALLGRLLQMGNITVVLCGRAANTPEMAAFKQLLPTLPDEIDRLERDVLPHLELLLLPNLRAGTAARIALGMDHGTVPYLTQAALWAGVPVATTPGWSQGGPPAYRELFGGYLHRLQEFGVQVDLPGTTVPAGLVPQAPDAQPPMAQPPMAQPPATPPPATFEGRVLTESDVLSLLLRQVSEIVLPPGTLVTALALDTARAKGLRLIRR